MRNVEIKAKVPNRAALLARIATHCGDHQPATVIPQHDVFYRVSGGRLKLRHFENGSAELIYYDRPDCEGPALSSFEKCGVQGDEVHGLNKVLARAFGVAGEVVKTRHLFLIGQTRVHVDTVQDLGDFVELEVCLRSDQSVADGEHIANDLMKKLGIAEEHLLATAYADLLKN